jgi:hypothetical protein
MPAYASGVPNVNAQPGSRLRCVAMYQRKTTKLQARQHHERLSAPAEDPSRIPDDRHVPRWPITGASCSAPSLRDVPQISEQMPVRPSSTEIAEKIVPTREQRSSRRPLSQRSGINWCMAIGRANGGCPACTLLPRVR